MAWGLVVADPFPRSGPLMQTLEDLFRQKRQQAADQAARSEQAHKANVELFTKMFLGLGIDTLAIAGTAHDRS